ncbi:hypothetical protein H0H93_015908 [Arthromyces matolae]|nr:hypothetical protein H0H93_015908 [Arthromyces matolae]
MYEHIRDFLSAEAGRDDTRQGRPIEELIKTTEMLSGEESQRLRTYCSTECVQIHRDLDEYGRLLLYGSIKDVEMDFMRRFDKNCRKVEQEPGKIEDKLPEIHKQTSQKLYDLRWGPTKVPIYNLLGLFFRVIPPNRANYLSIAQYLIDIAQVPVDGTDLSGTTALSHCFSTKPACDLDYAQMLYDAGGDVNHRNRYGGTVAEEIAQVYVYPSLNPEDAVRKETIQKAVDSFKWFLSHGGNVDIKDTDGITARILVDKIGLVELKVVLKEEDERRREGCYVSSLLDWD